MVINPILYHRLAAIVVPMAVFPGGQPGTGKLRKSNFYQKIIDVSEIFTEQPAKYDTCQRCRDYNRSEYCCPENTCSLLQKKISNAIISDNTISNRKSKEANTAVFFIDTRKSGQKTVTHNSLFLTKEGVKSYIKSYSDILRYAV